MPDLEGGSRPQCQIFQHRSQVRRHVPCRQSGLTETSNSNCRLPVLSRRAIFFINVPIGALAFVFGFLWLTPVEAKDPGRLDLAGLFLRSTRLALGVYALSSGLGDGCRDHRNSACRVGPDRRRWSGIRGRRPHPLPCGSSCYRSHDGAHRAGLSIHPRWGCGRDAPDRFLTWILTL